MRRLRVLIITDEMEVGGTQRQIVTLARHIDPSRFELTVAYFRNRSFLVDDLERAGVRVVCVPKKHPIDPVFLWKLRGLLKQGFDVIHCVSFTGELWGTVARKVAGRIPLITSVRSTYGWYSSLQWFLKRWVSRSSRCVVANSHSGADLAVAKMGIDRKTVRVVYNGIESHGGATADPQMTRRELGVAPDAVLCLFMGRLVPQKNVTSLLHAFARLSTAGRSFVLLIAGEGPLRGEIEALIHDLGLAGRAKLLGRREDAPRLVESCDLLVQPSLWEGLSNVILEAMAAGKPVVASDMGGRELVVNDVSGLLYPSGDVTALADCLATLIADDEMRRRMGEAGRRRVLEDFSMEAMVRTMESIYAECAGESQSGSQRERTLVENRDKDEGRAATEERL